MREEQSREVRYTKVDSLAILNNIIMVIGLSMLIIGATCSIIDWYAYRDGMIYPSYAVTLFGITISAVTIKFKWKLDDRDPSYEVDNLKVLALIPIIISTVMIIIGVPWSVYDWFSAETAAFALEVSDIVMCLGFLGLFISLIILSGIENKRKRERVNRMVEIALAKRHKK